MKLGLIGASAMFVFAHVSCVGCASVSVPITPGMTIKASRVMESDENAIRDCRFVGTVDVLDHEVSGDEEKPKGYLLARSRCGELGGTNIVLGQYHMEGFSSKCYRCGEARPPDLETRDENSSSGGWLGIHVQEVTPEMAGRLGPGSPGGALVSQVVDGGPADRAGVREGDLVLQYEGKSIETFEELPRMVASTAPGTRTEVKICRNGDERRCLIVVGTAPRASAQTEAYAAELEEELGWLYVNPVPEGARVRVLNIQPLYHPGIALKPGKYHVEVSEPGFATARRWVTVTGGNKTSEDITIERAEPAQVKASLPQGDLPDKPVEQRWAVVVGVSQYSDPEIPDLRYADKDAIAFYEFITSPMGGKFAKDHVKLLTNQDATRQNLENALFGFLKQPIEEDLVYIFFAGHGSPEADNPENMYFLTSDARAGQLSTTAFPMWDLATALNRHIKARKVVVIADACHSASAGQGSALSTRALGVQNKFNEYLKELGKSGAGKAILTSAEANEMSREGQQWGGGHGVYTYYLLEGLRGAADTDGDSFVSLGEAIDYVNEKVRRATNSAQHPDTAGTFNRNMPMAVVW